MSDAVARSEAAVLGSERCTRLLGNADFLWFVAEAITRPRMAREAELKDLTTDKEAREIAAHVREALETAETFVARQRDVYERLSPRGELSRTDAVRE